MKRFLTVGILLIIGMVCYGENKIKMVTYFPVPYVAYSKVNVNQQLDVGLTNSCAMNLGCSESGAVGLNPLKVTTANLNRGKLELNTGIAVLSNTVSLGSGGAIAEMNFGKNVRIGTLNNGYSLETEQMTLDVLKLFPSRIKNDFPSCTSTGARGAPVVSWQQLKMKDKSETFLVCGTPQEIEPEPEVDCSDPTYKASHKSECCPGRPTSDTVCYKKEGRFQTWENTNHACRILWEGLGPMNETQQEWDWEYWDDLYGTVSNSECRTEWISGPAWRSCKKAPYGECWEGEKCDASFPYYWRYDETSEYYTYVFFSLIACKEEYVKNGW